MLNMSRYNNSSNTVDKFGRQKINGKSRVVRGPPGIGFMLTADGQYDIQGKSLENVAHPKYYNDAATQEYVLSIIDQLRIQLTDLINGNIKQYFEQKYTWIEKRINTLKEDVTKNEVTLDSVNKEISLHCEQKYKGLEEKINVLTELVKQSNEKWDYIDNKFKTWFDR